MSNLIPVPHGNMVGNAEVKYDGMLCSFQIWFPVRTLIVRSIRFVEWHGSETPTVGLSIISDAVIGTSGTSPSTISTLSAESSVAIPILLMPRLPLYIGPATNRFSATQTGGPGGRRSTHCARPIASPPRSTKRGRSMLCRLEQKVVAQSVDFSN